MSLSKLGILKNGLKKIDHSICRIKRCTSTSNQMDTSAKRQREASEDNHAEQPTKSLKVDLDGKSSRLSSLLYGRNKLVPKAVLDKLTEEDLKTLEVIKSSCTSIEDIQKSIDLRQRHRLSMRLPEDFYESTYYIENGLRKVYPYPYLYQTYTKRRWIGRKASALLRDEFRDITEEQLQKHFDLNRLLVNGKPMASGYVLKDNDFISNRIHRHELPVLASPLKIIFEDKDTLVIDKPPSLPIHPCGRYRHNTVVHILHKQYKYPFDVLKVVHRLDRLVSGVLIIAKNSRRANVIETMIQKRDVQKEYVCRVDGKFPDGDAKDDSYLTVDKPLEVVTGKVGITVVHPQGKPSVTKFKRLSYNGKTSAVLCKPLTGRMHQIRVHLQYLGHPITNDLMYNSDAFGPQRGKGGEFGKSLQQLSRDVLAHHRAQAWMIPDDVAIVDDDEDIDSSDQPKPDERKIDTSKFLSEDERKESTAAIAHYFTNESLTELEEKFKYDADRDSRDPNCRDCKSTYNDPPPRRLFLYLHALRYSGTGWSYQSEMPVWARDEWQY